MSGTAVQCPTCGKTITPEEIEIGQSLVCPLCASATDEPQGRRQPEERQDPESK